MKKENDKSTVGKCGEIVHGVDVLNTSPLKLDKLYIYPMKTKNNKYTCSY